MAIYLTWNIYHGTLNGVPPSDRVVQIVKLGIQKNVDAICLQEVPQSVLDPKVVFGAPASAKVLDALDAGVAGWAGTYGVIQAYSENNPDQPHAATTADGYLTFFRKATFSGAGNIGFFKPASFKTILGTTLRPPFTVDLKLAGGATVTVMNWHVDIGGPQVADALTWLNALLLAPPPNLTLVLGDYNYAGPLNNAFISPPFKGWTDMGVEEQSTSGAKVRGLDHILCSGKCASALANDLGFKSDYHYPVAVTA